jgi:hypothetical protein
VEQQQQQQCNTGRGQAAARMQGCVVVYQRHGNDGKWLLRAAAATATLFPITTLFLVALTPSHLLQSFIHHMRQLLT